MKWSKRFLWLAAWGVWLWLGVGLHRELPRSLGPVVAKVPLETNEYVIGFLGDTHSLVIDGPTPSGGRGWFDVYDLGAAERRPLTERDKQRYWGSWKGRLAHMKRFSSPRRREYEVRMEPLLPFVPIKLPDGWATVDVVDNATGKVVWREWRYDLWWSRYESVDERLTALANGTVVRSPPSPNWPLLLFVQALLASPLVVFWAVLRSGRKASGEAGGPRTPARLE